MINSKGDKKLIKDTKYCEHTMQVNSRFDSTTFISGDIYTKYIPLSRQRQKFNRKGSRCSVAFQDRCEDTS